MQTPGPHGAVVRVLITPRTIVPALAQTRLSRAMPYLFVGLAAAYFVWQFISAGAPAWAKDLMVLVGLTACIGLFVLVTARLRAARDARLVAQARKLARDRASGRDGHR